MFFASYSHGDVAIKIGEDATKEDLDNVVNFLMYVRDYLVAPSPIKQSKTEPRKENTEQPGALPSASGSGSEANDRTILILLGIVVAGSLS